MLSGPLVNWYEVGLTDPFGSVTDSVTVPAYVGSTFPYGSAATTWRSEVVPATNGLGSPLTTSCDAAAWLTVMYAWAGLGFDPAGVETSATDSRVCPVAGLLAAR